MEDFYPVSTTRRLTLLSLAYRTRILGLRDTVVADQCAWQGFAPYKSGSIFASLPITCQRRDATDITQRSHSFLKLILQSATHHNVNHGFASTYSATSSLGHSVNERESPSPLSYLPNTCNGSRTRIFFALPLSYARPFHQSLMLPIYTRIRGQKCHNSAKLI